MKAELNCASITLGGQCAMKVGMAWMLLWYADSWDIHMCTMTVSHVFRTVYQ